jgi:Ni/Co efflux regulator RcnB
MGGADRKHVMSRFLITTALAGLLISTGAAMAQDRHERGDRNRGGQQTAQAATPKPGDPGMPKYQNFWGPGNERDNERGNRGRQAAPPATPPAASNGGSNNFRGGDNDRRDGNNYRGGNDNDRRGDFRNNDRRGSYDNRNNRQDWNRGGYRNNNNWSNYQRNFRSPQRYRGPSYVRPRGWYSQRWTFGQFLPSLFWTSNYWINDYYYYGLQAPPPGTVWVRDGFDAILIDRYDGQIIQVVYDVYY